MNDQKAGGVFLCVSSLFCYSPDQTTPWRFTSFLKAGMATQNGDFKETKFLFNLLKKKTFLITAIELWFRSVATKKTSLVYVEWSLGEMLYAVCWHSSAFQCHSLPNQYIVELLWEQKHQFNRVGYTIFYIAFILYSNLHLFLTELDSFARLLMLVDIIIAHLLFVCCCFDERRIVVEEGRIFYYD